MAATETTGFNELNRIRLVASDLDGTLLQNGNTEPSSEAFELIGELVDRGVIFLPASGRQYASLRKLFAPIADDLSYLCENGALVMFQDMPVVRRGFSRALGVQIARSVSLEHEAKLIVSGERHAYVLRSDEEFARHLREDIGNDIVLVDRVTDIDEPIIKVAFKTSRVMQQTLRDRFDDEFGLWTNVMTSGAEWTDIVPKGVDKGTALLDFGRLMGIAPQQMAAFGDNENDFAMLNLVGHPYLMERCNPSMRGAVRDATYAGTVEEELRRLLDTPGCLARA